MMKNIFPTVVRIIIRVPDSSDSKLNNQSDNLTKLRSLKTALMQDLLTGKVRVTLLPGKTEVGA